MDSKAILDYASFQLTPTRTRCDLVVFSGEFREKIASGLVDPFVSHLKYARDQISKGGYSITLRAPVNEDPSWFTKTTFQRFLRFVSTPEILESIVRIEREISQIDSSIQSNELLGKDAVELQGEGSLASADGITKTFSNSSKLPSGGAVDGVPGEENSRVHLQRLMDTRKALLQKDQAMAYARAVVAGYEMDTIHDLICFANTFGALRLREACIDFKELYKRKHSDDQWKDELAAVQACAMTDLSYLAASGIMITGENGHSNVNSSGLSESTSDLISTPLSDGNTINNQPAPEHPVIQPQLSWMNQFPPYLYNFQSPMHQVPSSYQGYPFPGIPPYYPGHMGWPPPPGGNFPQSDDDQNPKLSRKKENSSYAKGLDTSEEYAKSASSESYSGTDSDDEDKESNMKRSLKGQGSKRSKKKSSKTVVIRNINYITSQRHNGEANEIFDSSSGRTLSYDEASIREGVDDALASLDISANSKTRKTWVERGALAKNGSNGLVDLDSRNVFDSNISDGEKTTNTWDIFQNLLMSHEDPASKGSQKHHFNEQDVINSSDGMICRTGNTSDLEPEKMKTQPHNTDDSVLGFRTGGQDCGSNTIDFMNGENLNPSMKRTASHFEEALFSRQLDKSRSSQLETPADFASESSVMKHQKGEDWLVVRSSGGSRSHELENQNTWSNEEDGVNKEATVTPAIDDSFIIQTRSSDDDDQHISHWRTDLSIVPDIDKPVQSENRSSNMSGEPDDLCMVLVRELQESTVTSWSPEMDYELEISHTKAENKSIEPYSDAEKRLSNGKSINGKKTVGHTAKNPARDVRSNSMAGSFRKNKPDPLSRSKKVPFVTRSMTQPSRFEKDEEERKRREEMLINRQKRISERTATEGLNSKKVVPWK